MKLAKDLKKKIKRENCCIRCCRELERREKIKKAEEARRKAEEAPRKRLKEEQDRKNNEEFWKNAAAAGAMWMKGIDDMNRYNAMLWKNGGNYEKTN